MSRARLLKKWASTDIEKKKEKESKAEARRRPIFNNVRYGVVVVDAGREE